MRRIAFILYFVGMFVLVLLFMKSAREVESLDGLEINSRVAVSGTVVEERAIYAETVLLTLDSGIEGICECSRNFEGKSVKIEGVVSEYESEKQITVERITVMQ